QVRQGRAFLQHGVLLLADGQEPLAHIARDGTGAPAGLPLAALLGRAIPFDEAADAAIDALRRSMPGASGAWRALGDRRPIDALADRHAERFRSDEWTWDSRAPARSP
ncbi:MAG TPA: hypothetical protein VNK43_11490, partial [Gemmatimonadales bacterium]|nr:hypothetical protein [Gemmatimonadales bacterium]